MTNPPLLGVLGGMGPEATLDFLTKVLKASSPSAHEADHIPMRIEWRPDTPCRRSYMAGTGEDPLPFLQAAVRRLWQSDSPASAIVMPVVTVHYWHERLQAQSPVPILHAGEAVAARLAHAPAARRIAVLGTWVTLQHRLLDRWIEASGCEIVALEQAEVEVWLMPAILAVKSGKFDLAFSLLNILLERLASRGAEAAILACTELPVVLKTTQHEGIALIDATDALAELSVRTILSQRGALNPS